MKKVSQQSKNRHSRTSRLNNEKLPQIRLGIRLPESALELLSEEDSPWFESETEIEDGFRLARQNKKQLRRIKKLMRERLSESAVEAIQLRYFQGLTLRQIGVIMGLSHSSVHRKIERAVARLKKHCAD